MKKKVIWILVGVFVILPIGIGAIGSFLPSSSTSSDPVSLSGEAADIESADCNAPKATDLESIQSGHIDAPFKILNALQISTGEDLVREIQEIAPNAESENLIAGFIDQTDEIGVWTVGTSGGPINAINDVAKRISDWGSAAQPGSSADQMRTIIENSVEAETIKQCVAAVKE